MTTELDHIRVHAYPTYETRRMWCSVMQGGPVFFTRRLCEYRSIHISSLVKSEVKINNTSSISSTQERLGDVSAFLPSGEKENNNNIVRKKKKKKAVMVTFSLNSAGSTAKQQSAWLWDFIDSKRCGSVEKPFFYNKMFKDRLQISHERFI